LNRGDPDVNSPTVTTRLISRCLNDIPARIDEAALDTARKCLIDSIAVALAARNEDGIRILRSELAAGRKPEEAAIIGAGDRVPADVAALVNGMMISILLFDDNHMSMRGHPSAPIAPVVLALGDKHDLPLEKALRAFVLGYEVESWLGLWFNPSQYEIGWHATATQGTLGAAVAASYLLGLDMDRAARALGIAGSLAGGLRTNFGTMTMSFHAGVAASSGIQAAQLAAKGFSANADLFGGALGIGRVLSREWDDQGFSEAVNRIGEPLQIIDPGPVLKIYPCGRPPLPAVDCVMEIINKHGVSADDVARIECRVSYMYPRTLIHPRPQTGLQAKTSLEGCVAIAFVDNGPRLSSFTDAAVQRPAVQKLMEKITVTVPPELSENVPEVRRAPFDQPVTVTVATHDGRSFTETVRDHRGMPANPATDADIRRKFIGCAEGVLDTERVDEIIGYVHRPDASVRGLLTLLNG